MRPGLALLVVVVVGCTDGEAPPLLGADFSASVLDMRDGGGGQPDLVEVDGSNRMACTTVCGCPAGNNCEAGFCVAGTVTLFCCGTPQCTGSNACQQSNGVISQCSNPPDAGVPVDAGMGAACSTLACLPGLGGNTFCSVVCGRMATCTNQGGMNRCTP